MVAKSLWLLTIVVGIASLASCARGEDPLIATWEEDGFISSQALGVIFVEHMSIEAIQQEVTEFHPEAEIRARFRYNSAAVNVGLPADVSVAQAIWYFRRLETVVVAEPIFLLHPLSAHIESPSNKPLQLTGDTGTMEKRRPQLRGITR